MCHTEDNLIPPLLSEPVNILQRISSSKHIKLSCESTECYGRIREDTEWYRRILLSRLQDESESDSLFPELRSDKWDQYSCCIFHNLVLLVTWSRLHCVKCCIPDSSVQGIFYEEYCLCLWKDCESEWWFLCLENASDKIAKVGVCILSRSVALDFEQGLKDGRGTAKARRPRLVPWWTRAAGVKEVDKSPVCIGFSPKSIRMILWWLP